MTFKDGCKEDLQNVFFDIEEFGSEHIIDGNPLTVVLIEGGCESGELGAALKHAFNQKESAINRMSRTLYIREADVKEKLKRKLTASATIEVDGKKMFISDVKHPEGMYKLTIERHGM